MELILIFVVFQHNYNLSMVLPSATPLPNRNPSTSHAFRARAGSSNVWKMLGTLAETENMQFQSAVTMIWQFMVEILGFLHVSSEAYLHLGIELIDSFTFCTKINVNLKKITAQFRCDFYKKWSINSWILMANIHQNDRCFSIYQHLTIPLRSRHVGIQDNVLGFHIPEYHVQPHFSLFFAVHWPFIVHVLRTQNSNKVTPCYSEVKKETEFASTSIIFNHHKYQKSATPRICLDVAERIGFRLIMQIRQCQ